MLVWHLQFHVLKVEAMSDLTSIVKETSENGTDLSPDDIGSIEEMPEDTILSQQTSVNLVPFIGQRFVSQDAAYEFYCSFAKQCGFSIRRHRTRGKDGLKPSDDGKLQRNRKSSRCGCQAYMRIVKRADFDVPEWRITGFSNIHNHELLKSNEVQLLPAYCTMSADDKSRICMFAKAGMSSFRNVDRDNDAIELLKMCKDKKDKDPNFKYDFKIDANNRLEHIAWSYGSSIRSYEAFGDTIIFDTTHRLDAYDMLLGIWIGVDNHGMNCFFGCVFLQDENMQSFSWALKTFLGFMNGKSPQTILTDQNMWLKEALAIEMPNTKHAFCIWHIIARFSDWFSAPLGSQYDKWKAEFHRLYELYSVEDFEVGWRKMVDMYGLHGNRHIVSLYALRSFWALPFLRSSFFAGMTSTFQSESVTAYIQRFLSAQSQIDNFVEQVAAIVDFKDQTGAKLKMQQKVQKVSLKTGSPIESHAATVLTPYAFCKLQEELLSAPKYASLMLDENYFIVRHHTEMDGGCKVLWVPHDEFISYRYLPARWRDLCSSMTRPFQVSTSREHGGKIQLLQSMVSTLIAESVETEQRLDVSCDQISMVLSRIKEFPGPAHGANDISYNSPSDSLILPEVEDSDSMIHSFNVGNPHHSITLGKLKERRHRDGVDIYRKRRRCSVPCCGQFGHDATDCPMIGGDDLNGDGLGFL
ncbi:Protein FAR1-related sequence 11 [Vitis vinifera]|uniref:Protein FAR1-RELATED SEQUENCE n=1 Tax=Vitis vinifera TaxID=29760 RepID=A0A438FJ01_VITVI|nr:Protein FAR1-related sequence 11 [Vitis vinifera]